MINHIVDFLLINNEQHGLGFWSEQAFESSHHDFKVINKIAIVIIEDIIVGTFFFHPCGLFYFLLLSSLWKGLYENNDLFINLRTTHQGNVGLSRFKKKDIQINYRVSHKKII